ncbi:MAG TPA: methyltransferase domain-containing protein, partial [Patescibacteria group bacterium]|nr:methyltransferase domain-containing protein [Patescibacteria group bacterium]
IDTDAEAIEVAKRTHQGNVQIELRISDAQSAFSGESFDAVVALSTIEHVVDRPAFLRTVGRALTSGGIAFLNYDVGHFRSRDLKERLMVPISQLLARIGIQGPYMKKVNDAVFREQIQHEGLAVIQMRKHNIGCLKGFMKNASDNAVMDWYEFEERLHARFSLEELDPLMLSTTFVVTKP